jgi:hypothetical protein
MEPRARRSFAFSRLREPRCVRTSCRSSRRSFFRFLRSARCGPTTRVVSPSWITAALVRPRSTPTTSELPCACFAGTTSRARSTQSETKSGQRDGGSSPRELFPRNRARSTFPSSGRGRCSAAGDAVPQAQPRRAEPVTFSFALEARETSLGPFARFRFGSSSNRNGSSTGCFSLVEHTFPPYPHGLPEHPEFIPTRSRSG